MTGRNCSYCGGLIVSFGELAYIEKTSRPVHISCKLAGVGDRPEHDPEVNQRTARAYLCAKSGDHQGAIKLYLEALKLAPNNGNILFSIALAHGNLEDFGSAAVYFKAASEARPLDGEIHGALGLSYYHENRLDEAMTEINTCISYSPENSNAYECRAFVKVKQGLLDEAIDDLNQAIELHPTFWQAIAERAALYELLKQHDKALQDIGQVKKLYSPSAPSHLEHKDRPSSVQHPESLESYFEKESQKWDRNKDYHRVVRELTKLILLDSTKAKLFVQRASAFRIIGNHIAADGDDEQHKQLNDS
jgi:tetratricopeptide (TPR) repeat protein